MRNERRPDARRTCGRFTGMSARDRSPTGLEFVSKLFASSVVKVARPPRSDPLLDAVADIVISQQRDAGRLPPSLAKLLDILARRTGAKGPAVLEEICRRASHGGTRLSSAFTGSVSKGVAGLCVGRHREGRAGGTAACSLHAAADSISTATE